MFHRTQQGFTLAELLISLAILGEIATFTIPKIIMSQANGQYNASAKEAAAMVAGAFQQAQVSGGVTSSTKIADLIQYMNYIKVDSATVVDDIPGWTTQTCGSVQASCLKLHSGAMFYYKPTEAFGGTNTTNAIRFYIDPDSAASSAKAEQFYLQYNGKITDAQSGSGLVSSTDSFVTYSNASWFSW